jgi:hypothetical protein
MSLATQILFGLNTIDLIVFPVFMVWIIRRGIWLYDLQQFHRVFHLVELLFFAFMLSSIGELGWVEKLLLVAYFTTSLQHNFSLQEFLSPNAINGSTFHYVGPSALHYFGLLRSNGTVLSWIYNDITKKGVFVDPEEYDIACYHAGRTWGFVNYLRNYGVRLACDVLAIAVIMVVFG